MKPAFTKYIFLLLFLGTCFCFKAQIQRETDSLKKLLVTSKEDTNKVSLLVKLTWNTLLYLRDTVEGKHYIDLGLPLSRKLKYKRGIGTFFMALGHSEKGSGRYPLALAYFDSARKNFTPLKYKKGLGSVYGAVGSVERAQANYPEALEAYFKQLKIGDETGSRETRSEALQSLAIIYFDMLEYDKSLDYYQRALPISEEMKDDLRMGICLNGMGLAYARTYRPQQAAECYDKALRLHEKIGYLQGQGLVLSNIGNLYAETKDNKTALEYYLRALKISEQLGEDQTVASIRTNIGLIYKDQKNYREALRYQLKALETLTRLRDKAQIWYVSLWISDIYADMGDVKNAYGYFKTAMIYQDSVKNEQNTKEAVKTEMNYEFEKKTAARKAEQDKKDLFAYEEKKIQEIKLSRSRYFSFGLTGILILSLVIAYLFLRQNKLRSLQKNMQLEQKLLRSQMNPHFIFNSLQAIQNFILKQNQKDAVKYLSSFAALTRSVLENSRMEMIPLRKEITLLEHYLQLQKLRFGGRFEYIIEAAASLDSENTAIPPMLSQPFIENALEHGMRSMESGGLVSVSFSTDGSFLVLEIKDNGTGISKDGNPDKKHHSLATAITRERIALMNKKYRVKTSFEVSEAYPDNENKGVKVVFNIPLLDLSEGPDSV